MNMNKYLDIAPEVQQALADGRPVVALESTIISHGMPTRKTSRRPCSSSRPCATTAPCPPPSPSSAAV